MKNLMLSILTFLSPCLLWADGVPVALASPTPFGSGILSGLGGALSHSPVATAGVVLVAGGILEVTGRLWPTKNPAGVAYFVSDALRLLSEIALKWSQFLDSILPQRIKVDDSKKT